MKIEQEKNFDLRIFCSCPFHLGFKSEYWTWMIARILKTSKFPIGLTKASILEHWPF